MNKRRTHVKAKVQAAVLRNSRRRCCICFGLNRDDGVKRGQIAHLDKNPSNADLENLAWLCLPHHDEYDSTTRQSKSLHIDEVKAYRSELYETYASWANVRNPNHLLRFLAATLDDDALIDGAIKVASRYRAVPELLVEEVLSWPQVDSLDMDLWVPHLALLEDFKGWGLLTYDLTQPNEYEVRIRVKHAPICTELLTRIRARKGSHEALQADPAGSVFSAGVP